MRFFFRSRQFKIFLAVTASVIALSIVLSLIGGYISPQAGILQTITEPFKALAAGVKHSVDNLDTRLNKSDELLDQNEKLKEEINSLRDKLVEYESAINENEILKDFLEIKENNPDFEFCPALISSRDPDDEFGGFTVNRGTHHGIKLYDPVITDAGLVGFVTEVGFSSSKVTTVLDPSLTCGAYSVRTNDAGVVSGTREFALEGLTRLYNIPRTCTIAVGDIIITSGGGVFPDKLIIGTVENIESDPVTSSLYAVIKPTVDLKEIRNVMILTSFDGQGKALSTEGK